MPRIQVQRGTGVSRLGVTEASHRVATNIQFTPYPNDICKEISERLIIDKFFPKIEDRIKEHAGIMFRAMKTESRMSNSEVYQRLTIGIMRRLFLFPDPEKASNLFELQSKEDVDRLIKESMSFKDVKWEDLFTSEAPSTYKASDLIRELRTKYPKNLSLDSLGKRFFNLMNRERHGYRNVDEITDGLLHPTIQASDKSGKVYWADLSGLSEEERDELIIGAKATLEFLKGLRHSLLTDRKNIKNTSSYEELIDLVEVSTSNDVNREKFINYLLKSKPARELAYKVIETYNGDINDELSQMEIKGRGLTNFSTLDIHIGYTSAGKWEYVPQKEDYIIGRQFQHDEHKWYSFLLGCEGGPYEIEVETSKGVYTLQNPVDVIKFDTVGGWSLSPSRTMGGSWDKYGELPPPYKSILQFSIRAKSLND